jgi:hypothetical protein
MPAKNHGPMYGLRSNDPVNKAGRNGRVVAPVPGSEPDACIVRFEDSTRSERHDSHTLADGRCDGRPATGWC